MAGDALRLDLTLRERAEVMLGSVAAEKVYGSEGATASMDTCLRVEGGACLTWLPQETILFGGARFGRRCEITLSEEAGLVAADIVVFGRRASGETHPSGWFQDSWRVHREGRLVFAEETRLQGAIGHVLDRAAVASGARAVGLLLIVPPERADLDCLRAKAKLFEHADPEVHVETGASQRDGVACARLLARSPERLRTAVPALLSCVEGAEVPRSWR